MAKDKRVKGCPNEACEMHTKKKKQPAENDYCPKCGAKLIFVCEKCFCEIEDIDSKHKLCLRCEAEASEKKEKMKEDVKNMGSKVVAFGAAGVAAVGAGMKNEGLKNAKNLGVEVVKKAVEVAPKVVHK